MLYTYKTYNSLQPDSNFIIRNVRKNWRKQTCIGWNRAAVTRGWWWWWWWRQGEAARWRGRDTRHLRVFLNTPNWTFLKVWTILQTLPFHRLAPASLPYVFICCFSSFPCLVQSFNLHPHYVFLFSLYRICLFTASTFVFIIEVHFFSFTSFSQYYLHPCVPSFLPAPPRGHTVPRECQKHRKKIKFNSQNQKPFQ